jgi:tetratricopeptide (TPR) repeat protein
MIRKASRISLLILFISALAGCSAIATKPSTKAADKSQQAEGAAQVKAAAAEPAPVETNIAPSMLYQLLVAEIAVQRGQLGVAIENYMTAARMTHDPKTAARAAQIARYAQAYDKAGEAAQILIQSDPNNADARLLYASILMLSGQSSQAVPQYLKMLELSKDKPGKGFNIIANQLVRLPDRSAALSVMAKIVESYPEDPDAQFAYAHLSMRQAKFDQALASLDKALETRPDWSNAVILRARVVALQKGRDDALKYLEEVLEGDLSKNLDVGLSYAKMLVEAKDYEKAMGEFVRLTELAPTNMDIFYPAGVLALQQQHYDLSRKLLTKVMKSGKHYYEANYYLGQVAEQKKETDTAVAHYTKVKRGELYFNAQMRVVALLASKRDFTQAKQRLSSIHTTNEKQQLQLILLQGDLYKEQGKYQQAKQFYTDMLEKMPEETSLRYARALVAEKLGEIDLVESDLQTILQVEPSNAQVLNALGYTLADRTDRYQEALGYIKKALDMEPNDAAIMDSMGWVLYRLGNYQEAISQLRRANDIAKDPEIAAHLGEVLWVSGNKDAAKDVWNTSLKGHPDHKVLLKVMKRFGQ